MIHKMIVRLFVGMQIQLFGRSGIVCPTLLF